MNLIYKIFLKPGYLIASIVHEFVHLVYNNQAPYNHCVWLEEGLAQFLSGQKSFLESDENKYFNWLKINILEKELPPITYLKKHGSNYGEFCDCNSNKYNGYDVSYALLRFIVEEYSEEKIYEIIQNNDNLLIFEKNIIDDFKNKYITLIK